MTDRPKALSRSATVSGETPEKRSSFFGGWRRSARPASGESAAQHVGLEGKELRDAVWKQQRQRESLAQAVARPMRVIRYSPPRSSPSSSAGEDDDDDDDDLSNSNAGSARGAGPQTVFEYDGVSPHDEYSTAPQPRGNSRLGRSMQRVRGDDESSTSRLSLTLSRLSFSSSARSSLASYKAKKYDVEWKNDDDVVDCQVCHLAFTKWSRRRHHCRVCGDIICDDCSPDQVHIDGRFTRAKRSCTACFGLLEAMMHLGDPHVKMVVEKDAGTREWVDATPSKKSKSQRRSPAPVHHDRLAEIQRVTAAGKKARRHGGGDVRKCVIHAQWLRAWLAFTRGHESNTDNQEDLYGGKKARAESASSSLSSGSSTVNDGEPPGPINNLSLLVMRKGCLLPRDGLVQIENQDFTGSGGQSKGAGRGDYQTIPYEVWDVLARYYGGGPRIEIVPSTIVGEPDRWVVDAAAVVRSGRAQKTNPNAAPGATSPALTVEEKVLERALMERHDPFCILLDMPAMSNRAIYDPQQQYAAAEASSRPPTFQRSVSDSLTYVASPAPPPRAPGPSGVAARTKPEPPRAGDRGYRQPTATPRDAERSPTVTKPPPQPQQARRTRQERGVVPPRAPAANNQRDHDVRQQRSQNDPPRGKPSMPPSPSLPSQHHRREAPASQGGEPTAASAASAFALAMKEARLKQQRAIAGGNSRRSPAFD